MNPYLFGLAGGLVWGLSLALTTLISLYTGYAAKFLELIADIYPGYEVSLLGALIAFGYGLLDMFVFLFLIIWIYKRLDPKQHATL